MKSLRVSNFHNYRFDRQTECYRAVVDVSGVRGLFRRECTRDEAVWRLPGSRVWYFARNGQPAPLSIWDLEQQYKEREIGSSIPHLDW